MFTVRFSVGAADKTRVLRGFDRARILDGIKRVLRRSPLGESGDQKKLMAVDFEGIEPVWQLRIDPFRVLYDVDADAGIVTVLAVRRKGRKTTGEIL